MRQQIFAVIDTNVLVSAILSHNADAATVRVIDCIRTGIIVPVFNAEIIEEYLEVLSRPKFNLAAEMITKLIISLKQVGVVTERTSYNEKLPDPKDRVFYEVSLTGDSYLVTGNIKHFPHKPKIVTPAEMMRIIGE